MPELITMYHSSNSAQDISMAKLYILGACFEFESRKSSGVQITLTPTVTSYRIWVGVFEEAEPDYMTHNLP